jgi:hypothetical protein
MVLAYQNRSKFSRNIINRDLLNPNQWLNNIDLSIYNLDYYDLNIYSGHGTATWARRKASRATHLKFVAKSSLRRCSIKAMGIPMQACTSNS